VQRWKTAVPMLLLCLLLSACSGTEDRMQEALHFRTDLLEASECSFTAEITAQGDSEVFECTLDCVVHQDGTATVTVVEPEEIAGISATVSKEGTRVVFDGLELDCGDLRGSVTPVGAPGLLHAAWTGGYIAAAGSEDGTTMTRYLLGSGDAERQVNTWFTTDGRPALCEVFENGQLVLDCQLSSWNLTSTEIAHVEPGGSIE